MPLFLMSINSLLYMSTSKTRDRDLLSPQESILLASDKNSNSEPSTFSVPYNISVFSRIADVGGCEEECVNYHHYL
jgi:hypothetical protein